jgi:hypothetical protein
VGGSLVIFMEASKMLCGMMCPAGVGAGSAVRKSLFLSKNKNIKLPSLYTYVMYYYNDLR